MHCRNIRQRREENEQKEYLKKMAKKIPKFDTRYKCTNPRSSMPSKINPETNTRSNCQKKGKERILKAIRKKEIITYK